VRVRGFLVGYLGLVALSVAVSPGGSTKTSGLFGWASTVIDRALSPDVPAIPDRSASTGGGQAAGAAAGAAKAATSGASAVGKYQMTAADQAAFAGAGARKARQ